MKAVGKKRTTSETSNDPAGAVNFGVVDGGGSESGGEEGGYAANGASFAEGEYTPLQKREAEHPRVEDSEEEAADYDDEDEEEEEEKEEELADPIAVFPPEKDHVLREDYYEVEAIRRKRIRRGQPQYLIKWHEWAEADNTWEPLENLAGIPDVVADFEARLRSAKRKRKRKHAVDHIQPKKRLERSATPYNLRQFPENAPDNHHTQSAPLPNISIPDIPAFPQTVLFADEVENNGDASNLGNSNHAHGNRSVDAPEAVVERNEENDYDPKLSELRATTRGLCGF